MSNLSLIKKNIQSSIAIKTNILDDQKILDQIELISQIIIKCYNQNGKVLFCGNGGSAADSQHLAAELSGRYYYDRPPLSAEALHVNTSYITAVANDYSFDVIYSRMIEAIGNKGDILIGLSTSGNSKNIINAFKQARSQGMVTIGMTGKQESSLTAVSDIIINVPSNDTPRIQEIHMLIGHTLCEIVEKEIFPI